MITCFPTPYPDEIFYSICARYSERMGYQTKRAVTKDLFGSSHVAATVALPCRFTYLVNNLPSTYGYSIDKFIDEHTFFPFFRSFLSQSRVLGIREAMREKKGADSYRRLGITACNGHLPKPQQLRFCPLCVNEDRNRFGECYWHRIHQIPGVEVCPIHQAFLGKIDSSNLYCNFQSDFLSAEKMTNSLTPIMVDPSNFCQAILLNIALDTIWIMQQDLSCDQTFFKQRYRMLFTELGLSGRQIRGSFDIPLMLQAFKAYYPADFLRMLSCDLTEHNTKNWFYQLFNKNDRFIYPLYHLLLIHFLGHNMETFVCLTSSPKPFGHGPWPCLNAVSQHYQQKVVYNCSISVSNSRDKKPRGVFKCECGFVYSHMGPDPDKVDSFRSRKVLAVGPIWEEALRGLWENPAVSLRDIAQRLGLTRPAIQSHAMRLGLSFPRPGGILPHPTQILTIHLNGSLVPVKNREYFRTLWLNAIQKYPGIGSEILRKKYSNVYTWLYKYDRSWQKEHIPQIPKKKGARKPRIDWIERDKRIAEEISTIVLQIKSSKVMPEQITKAAILRRMEKGETLKRCLSKGRLPLTEQRLYSIVESPEEFVIRRIWWMRDLYLRESHILPKRWLFARQTGAAHYNHSSPKVKEAFESAMQSLENFFYF